ncbi:carbon catabolite repressor protein [Phytophthora cinnamomi]|uniref:carbon catabolite repressor protein n=1 Tax=Phytophthora cinnamomi TaxID=4785 RepID=UPI00355A5654|nr:carbon catabolite repressor protein [Phytophthora cinnamomi]
MSLSRTNSKSGASGSGRSGDVGATPYLQQLRRQLSSLGSSQKPQRRSTQPPGPAAEKSAAICSAVQLALLEPLAAVQLEVNDVSCARLQYRLLGTKRYWYRSVKQEKQGKILWEVKIYQICCRKSTVDTLLKCTWHTMPRLAGEDVVIKSVGFFDTEKAAMTALEAAVKARDVTNPLTGLSMRKSELPMELVKYFQVVVVSDRFQRKSQNERLDMIFGLLLNATPHLKRVMKYKAKTFRRIKEMREMRIEWERRQPIVEKELSQLTEEDLDRGWGEAFETEKHVLHFSLELSVEDILSKKQQVREYEEEIEDLRIELEDLERDMEECILNETVELESYRDMELQRAGSLFADEKARRVRLQRIRWGTRNVRKHVIMRERQDLQVFAKEALAKRQVEELSVLAFEKKKFVKHKLEQAVEDAARARAKQNEVMMEMKRDSDLLHGFNEAVQRMQTITQDFSFQYRLPKTDLREDPESAMCSDCGRITCDCHLRNNEEADEDGTSTGISKHLDVSNAMINARSRNRLARRWRYQD